MENHLGIPPSVAVQRYEEVRDELKARTPHVWESVVDLCSKLPSQIDLETVWLHGRDKPCWSNIKVAIGERISEDIKKCNDFDSYKIISSDDWEIVMLDRGPSWKKNDNFELVGQAAREFVGKLTKGGLASYLWRLFAIRNLAVALANNTSVKTLVTELSQRDGQLGLDEWEKWSNDFSRGVGMGWGFVTAYHMLTDLGLTPKPDMWLTLSAVRMGLLQPEVPSDLNAEDARKFEHQAVRAVIQLSQLIQPTAYPQDPRSALREVDKVLMEWGRQGLSRPM